MPFPSYISGVLTDQSASLGGTSVSRFLICSYVLCKLFMEDMVTGLSYADLIRDFEFIFFPLFDLKKLVSSHFSTDRQLKVSSLLVFFLRFVSTVPDCLPAKITPSSTPMMAEHSLAIPLMLIAVTFLSMHFNGFVIAS